MRVDRAAEECIVWLKFDHRSIFVAILFALGIIKENLLVLLRIERLLVNQLELEVLPLLLRQLLLITEILDQLIHFQNGNPAASLTLEAVVRLDDDFEELHWGMEQLVFAVAQLFVALLF